MDRAERTSGRDLLRIAWPWLALAIPLIVATVLLSGISPAMARVVTDTLIKLVMVAGLYIFIGNSGVLSFGHGAFMIVGAYVSAWLTIPPMMKNVILPALPEALRAAHLHPALGAVVAILACALLALLVGIPLMRLSGIAASIATFALFVVVNVIFNNWTGWTKGTASLVGLPVYTGPYIALAAALAAMLVAYLFQRSRFGLMLQATREDAVAARAAGMRVERLRLYALILSAAVVALGGILWGHNNGALSTANNVYLNLSFLVIAMLVVGGMRSLAGAVVGTVLLAAIAEVLRRLETGIDIGGISLSVPGSTREVVLGLCMLLVLILRSEGLTMGREAPWPGKRRTQPLRETQSQS